MHHHLCACSSDKAASARVVITDVQTTPAPRSDFDLLPTIQADLAARELLPAEQLVDAGYVTAEHLVTSQHDH